MCVVGGSLHLITPVVSSGGSDGPPVCMSATRVCPAWVFLFGLGALIIPLGESFSWRRRDRPEQVADQVRKAFLVVFPE